VTRPTLIAGNWKMNLGRDSAVALAEALARDVTPAANVDVAVFPPFPWLLPVRDALDSSGILLGAQNCHQLASGAFTGEVSAPMLAPLCDLILAGHSERRQLFGESDGLVGEKVAAILAAGTRAVLCVGETLSQRNAGEAHAVVARQLTMGLAGVAPRALDHIVVAYEPVWAIGTGVAAAADDAQTMCGGIRAWLVQRFGPPGAEVQILYGGSVTPDNAGELFGQPDVDGGLVGGASLKAESFARIVAAGVASRAR
jgi:triosephosphate isomerase (TIM)